MREVWKRLKKNKLALASFIFILGVLVLAILAPLLSPYSYDVSTGERLLAPFSKGHLLGTDFLERDLLSRLLFGARMSMLVGFATAFCALFFGTSYGALSGYIGGRTDNFLMRIVDIFYTFPSIVLIILVTVIFGRGMFGILLALTLIGWADVSRLVRGQILQTKEEVYVLAAKSVGLSHFQIVLKHILPNIVGPLVVTLTFQIPTAVLGESFLSFIGLGLKPPYASWGTLAHDAWKSGALRYVEYSYLILVPSLAIFSSMLAFNLFGDGLRDALDPKLKRSRS
ncbi:MAG: ABC transporter permease [Deltaproteobacteria bacterium]|nr:ABC transporter permease [Deltaproteobacteria bacterium]